MKGGFGVGVQWGLSSAPEGAALGCSRGLGGAGRGSPGCEYVGQQLELLWFGKQINTWMLPGWVILAGWGPAESQCWGDSTRAPRESPTPGSGGWGSPVPLPTGHCADGTKLPPPIGLTVDIPKPLPCKHMDYPHNPDSVLEKPPGISGRIVAATRGTGGCGGPWGWETRGSNTNHHKLRGAAPSSRAAGEVTRSRWRRSRRLMASCRVGVGAMRGLPAQQPRVAPALTAHCGADGVTAAPAASDPAVSMATASPASLSQARAIPRPRTRLGQPPAAAAAALGEPRGREGAESSPSSSSSPSFPRPHTGGAVSPHLISSSLDTARVRCPDLFRWGQSLSRVPSTSPCPPGEHKGQGPAL